jgi:predicted aldo/keto reductase-like oxidoreductase
VQYRTFGKLDWKPSALGFGAMRLPTLDKDPAKINEAEAIHLIRHAIDNGVNYVDTAYPYHGGQSEIVVGKALKDGYRERVHLATKMPVWLVKTADDFDRLLDEQLKKLDTDHIDFYLLHALGAERWQPIRDMGVREWADKAIASGRISHIGFSFHDKYPAFEEIVNAYDNWTFCQIHYNFLEEEEQAGTKGLELAGEKGLGVVIMGPLSGGLLSNQPPAPVQALWDSYPVKRTPSDWALQWVWNHPQVSVALSGMTTMQQVVENLASANVSGANSMSQEELDLVGRVSETYRSLRPIPCTDCKYCQPCPNGVKIPDIFSLYNTAHMFNAPAHSRRWYAHSPLESRADQCLECGECESQCPQKIEIINWLPKVHEYLTAA